MQSRPISLKDLARFEGMISEREAVKQIGLASEPRAGAIVEIGSWRGKSAIAMALGAMRLPIETRPLVYCIEPHAGFTGVYGGKFGPQDRSAFFKAMLDSGCAEAVALVNLPSLSAARGWRGPIGLLFIDGDHSEAGVSADVEAWTPHVVAGGIVAFDDAKDEKIGPAKAIARLIASGDYEKIDAEGKIVVLRKMR
ncbi:MAG TPA: class I SAM-dependent methyltransferase [Rhizomicrobium sp.]|nr:class I SAM-dependent methyltransferase [Rhizomicrobium sp.]